MIKFTREKVLLLHQIISEATGGDPNLRDVGLLDSALESAFQTFDGNELYPTKQEKAARIAYSLIFSGIASSSVHLTHPLFINHRSDI